MAYQRDFYTSYKKLRLGLPHLVTGYDDTTTHHHAHH